MNPRGDVLRIWTLYESPSDFPGMFVLREWAATGNPDGEPRPLPGVYVSPRPEPLRAEMARRGLYCMPRNPDDEPHIVETWI